MAPQAQEILDRIDEYLNYAQMSGGPAGSDWEKLMPLIQDARARLHEMRQHAPVNALPEGTKGRWFKMPLMRLMRLVSGRQASYNYTAIAALEALTGVLESLARAMAIRQEAFAAEQAALAAQQVAFAAEQTALAAQQAQFDSTIKEQSERLSKIMEELKNLFNWVDKTLTPTTMDLKDKVRELQIRTEQAPAAQIIGALASHQQLINEHTGQISYLSRKVEPLETHVKERQDQFGRELLIVLRDLERRFEQTLEHTKAAQSPEERRATGEAVLEVLDQVRYFYFELRARGGEEYLHKKFSRYVETIGAALNREPAGDKAGKPRALDLGCGNGLYLSLMAAAGFDALGVDSNTAMLASARARGVAVEQADALAFLARQPENSFDVISAMEFIEHLPKERLVEFAGLAARALRPGGMLLLETLNARTFAAYQWFFMDLTHQWLVLPEALQVLLEARGLEIVMTEEISPVEDWKRLAEIEGSAERENVTQLNAALFGMQEYYCLARKPR